MLLAGNTTDRLTTLLIIGIALTALVLIIQLVIISKLVAKNKETTGLNNSNSYVDNAIARINEQEQAEIDYSGELAAVITAAIHAYMQDACIQDQALEVPAGGFIVRSIKRIEARRR
jgi:Na+-transporting methylmalonyl-CoA/oxaloacetate decarboxylase gamma subunit